MLYLLGGSGELAAGWWLDGRAGFIADNLIGEGRAVPMIIAMPNNQVVHRSDPALDLFASFGILSAGDPEPETSTPEFLNDPDINTKVDYLLVGLGTRENVPGNRAVVFHQILEKYRVAHDYAVGGSGAHDWGTWRWLLHERLLPNLFTPRK